MINLRFGQTNLLVKRRIWHSHARTRQGRKQFRVHHIFTSRSQFRRRVRKSFTSMVKLALPCSPGRFKNSFVNPTAFTIYTSALSYQHHRFFKSPSLCLYIINIYTSTYFAYKSKHDCSSRAGENTSRHSSFENG